VIGSTAGETDSKHVFRRESSVDLPPISAVILLKWKQSSYELQNIGELLIMPIGKLAPKRWVVIMKRMA
jgi:hypothetical protein